MSYPQFPSAPPPPPAEVNPLQPPAPAALRPVIVLLVVNLALSIITTIIVLSTKNSLIEFQLDHRHIVDPHQRQLLRDSISSGIWGRAVGNVVVSIVYVFLVRRLLRGQRRAYIRVLIIGLAGIVALALLWLTPYPAWMRVEQVVQSLVLAALLYFVTRPEVRSHFPKGNRGRRRSRPYAGGPGR